MNGGDDQIGMDVPAQRGNGGLCRLQRVREAVALVVRRLFPLRNCRSGEADDGDSNAIHGAQNVGVEGARRDATRFGEGVGGEPGEARVEAGAIQVLEAVVEVVVAEDQRVVAEAVHGGHHGILAQGAAPESEPQGQSAGGDVGLVDGFERRALDGVAAVDEQRIGGLAAGGSDQRGDLGEPAVGGLAGEIVDGNQVAVQVRGGQQGDGDLPGRGGGRERYQRQSRPQNA